MSERVRLFDPLSGDGKEIFRVHHEKEKKRDRRPFPTSILLLAHPNESTYCDRNEIPALYQLLAKEWLGLLVLNYVVQNFLHFSAQRAEIAKNKESSPFVSTPCFTQRAKYYVATY